MLTPLDSIYLGDTLDLMDSINDEFVNMVLSDSPYGVDYQSGRSKVRKPKIANDKLEDFEPLIANYLSEAHRIMKPDTTIFMFCSWKTMAHVKAEMEKHFDLKNLIVWEKNNHGAGSLPYGYSPKHELVLFGHKGKCPRQPDRGRTPDVKKYAKVSTKVHQTAKPIPLLGEFIEDWTSPGDIIFDGFMGSGATGFAARETGRHWIGAELDPDIHEKTRREFLRPVKNK